MSNQAKKEEEISEISETEAANNVLSAREAIVSIEEAEELAKIENIYKEEHGLKEV